MEERRNVAVCSRKEVDALAKVRATHHGKPAASLRGGEGRAERGGGQLVLVAEVAFHEVDATPEAAELETPFLLFVSGTGAMQQNRLLLILLLRM